MINLINRGGFYVRVSVDQPMTLEERLNNFVEQMVYLGASKELIMSKTRESEHKTWRQIAMWWARKNQLGTWKAIGFYFKRDHSTTIHAHNLISDLIDSNDKEITEKLNKLGIKYGQ